MSVKITGLNELNRAINKKIKDVEKAAKKSIRKGLNAGAKEAKQIMKPYIPVLGSSTNFRQKGTVKNNLRHTTKMAKDKLEGATIVRIRRPKGKRMARVGENTRDRTDPFYWFMLDRGTSKMTGRNFMEKGASAAKDRAERTAERTFIEEFKNAIK
ncbi:hypothetical protein Q7381_03745 [Glaesserella parasuis]|uniref:HK97-gp10 family putative phage morphogenesis protein n=1 Tax=uncultured Actinobacillus sp. TaxID=417616 RepID=UPI0025CBEBF1|nr:HK97-gp10 family putative phage morphogenesis protein [uncultured Actinobacillus sp.]MDO9831103.1 hypothetical protein [Glaesserella parasuis]MDP0119485.1 hypothetical protein [Glaesserella parasuis]